MEKAMQSGRLNRLRKKIACGVLGCLLAVGAMLMPETGMTAQAAYTNYEKNGITYEILSDNTCVVRRYDSSKAGTEVHIPAEIDYKGNKYPVVGLYSGVFWSGLLEKITLEEGLLIIKDGAFEGSELKEIEIPASVNWIEQEVFWNCKNLTKISFRRTKPPVINAGIFDGCNNLKTIQIPVGANKDEWEAALQGKGLDINQITIQFYTPTFPGSDSASTSTSTSTPAEQGGGEVSLEAAEEEPVNRIPEHVCQYEWETVREAGAGQDGLEQYLCKLCGSVQSTLTIPASQYQVQELYTKVTGAAEGETVTYDMGQIHTVCDKLFTKLQERGDITLILTYRYKGADHRTTFPAGADYTELMADEEQFYGMLGLNGRCGIVTE